MGRKSALTPEQWVEVERRHLIGGESINALSIEFGINESSIRRKIKPNKAELPDGTKSLQDLATEKAEIDRSVKRIAERIAELPIARQQIVCDLARKLTSISEHLASAAEYGSMTAHKLSHIAHSQAEQLDEAAPLESNVVVLKSVMALTAGANEASKIGLNLLAANKGIVASEPPAIDATTIPSDPVEAARAYQRLIGGN